MGLLRSFVARHFESLTRPSDGAPLGADLESAMASLGLGDNLQAWAELAMTRYLRSEARGLGQDWDALIAYFRQVPALAPRARELVEGSAPLGPAHNPYDPGLMGTGFTRAARVKELAALLDAPGRPPPPEPSSFVYAGCLYPPDSVDRVARACEHLATLYRDAGGRSLGLLFADFRELRAPPLARPRACRPARARVRVAR